MYKSIDDDEEAVDGFKYTSAAGEEDFVSFTYDGVTIAVTDGYIPVPYEDVPKLIKALQAAYDYKRGAELE